MNETHFNVNRDNRTIDNYVSLMNENNDLLVYINLEQNDEIMSKYYSNVLATSVQKFRKELNLRPWNKIHIDFITESVVFIDAYNKYSQDIVNIVRNSVSMNSMNMSGSFDETILDYEMGSVQIRIYKKLEESVLQDCI